MAVELYIPKMSDHMEEAVFLEWLVSEGEAVEEGQPLLAIETDKVDAEVESPATGVIKSMRQGLEEGVKLPVGETIAYIAQNDDEQVPTLEPWETKARGEQSPTTSSDLTSDLTTTPETDLEPSAGPIPATPAARRVAREHGVDLKKVRGSGPNGRVEESDVRAYVVGS